MSVEEALVKKEPETGLELNETTDTPYTYQVPIKLEIEFKTEVKCEPLCESSADSVDGEDLYTDHAVKHELALGPVRVQSPNTVAPSVISGNTGACGPQHTASTSSNQTQAPTHNASLPFKVKHDNETISALPPAPLSYQSRYVCQTCQKEFARTDLLRIHKRTHTGEKPYSCNICSREFAQLAHLKMHVMIHTGEKPHRCERCSMGFRQLSSLKRHERTHAGEKPHGCNVCGKRFTRKGHLVKHTLARHDKGHEIQTKEVRFHKLKMYNSSDTA